MLLSIVNLQIRLLKTINQMTSVSLSLFFLKKKISQALSVDNHCLVFINDYHLLLVPEMIREKLPEAAIGIFIHATFPSSEIFRCLQSKLVK